MKFEIKNRFTGHVIFSSDDECDSFSLAVEAAINQKINLTSADLTGADLTRAILTGADLTGADFRRCGFDRCGF